MDQDSDDERSFVDNIKVLTGIKLTTRLIVDSALSANDFLVPQCDHLQSRPTYLPKHSAVLLHNDWFAGLLFYSLLGVLQQIHTSATD